MLTVDTQRHRRRLLGHVQQFLPMLRVIRLQTLNPPARMIPLRLEVAIGLMHQVITFAHETAQAGIDEPALGLGLPLFTRGLYRLIDQRMNRVWGICFAPAQGQGRAEQGIHRRWWCFRGQLLTQSGRTAQLSQGQKTQGLNAWTQILGNTLQLCCQ